MNSQTNDRTASFLNPLEMNVSQAFRMALPLVATSFIFCLIGAIDMALAGWQSAAAQAAVGVADQCIFATMLIGTGLAAATGCFVSQSIGANEFDLSRRYAADGIVFAILFGLLSTLACFCGAETLIKVFGCSPASSAVALPYLQICAFGNLPFMVVIVQAAILRALGKTGDCLRMWSLIGLVSIGGGVGLYMTNGLPCSQSMTSLAVAWDVGAIAGVVFAGVVLERLFFSQNKRNRCNRLKFRQRMLKFGRVGVPVLLSEACSIASLAAVYAILGRLPSSESLQAAYTVTLKIEETFGILPLVAMSTISATMIGHQVGAHLFVRARNLGWQLAAVSAGIMLLCGIFVREASPALAALFSADTNVLNAVGIGTASATVSMPLIALALVLFANLEGAGKTTLPLAAQFGGYIVCRIPLAYIFAVNLELGYTGVWLAILISRGVTAILAMIIYRVGFASHNSLSF